MVEKETGDVKSERARETETEIVDEEKEGSEEGEGDNYSQCLLSFAFYSRRLGEISVTLLCVGKARLLFK